MTVQVPVFQGRDDEYTIHVGKDIIDETGTLCSEAGLGRRALVVTNEAIAPLYLKRVISSLQEAGFEPSSVIVPAGEGEKNWERAGHLLDECVKAGLERTSFVVALGGGVIGDLAGFVAAVYMRGIRVVQIPTSLLSQVDASVGGKVAVNHPAGKNLLGAFHQPSIVISDIKALDTLPDRELAAGMAEVVKHGLIRDPELYKFVADAPAAFKARDFNALQRVVVDSCRIKAGVVERDEKEHGERAILNFGHTVGHAIEAAAGYGTYTHGEAIAIGMVAEMILSADIGHVDSSDVHTLIEILHKLDLPSQPAPGLAKKASGYLMRDKKVHEGRLRLALLHRIGEATITDTINPRRIDTVLRALESGEYKTS